MPEVFHWGGYVRSSPDSNRFREVKHIEISKVSFPDLGFWTLSVSGVGSEIACQISHQYAIVWWAAAPHLSASRRATPLSISL
jgi:hypothetical protein